MTSKVMAIPLLTWVFLCTCAHARKLDCTRFVFAPRCRGVAAKKSDMTSYMGPKWQPDDAWMLYNRGSDLPDNTGSDVMSPPQDHVAPQEVDNKVVRLLSKVLGVAEENTPPPRYIYSDRRNDQERIKVYFDALLQSLEDTAEGGLKEDVIDHSA